MKNKIIRLKEYNKSRVKAYEDFLNKELYALCEKELGHNWSDWQFKEEKAKEEYAYWSFSERVCKLCGEVETKDVFYEDHS